MDALPASAPPTLRHGRCQPGTFRGDPRNGRRPRSPLSGCPGKPLRHYPIARTPTLEFNGPCRYPSVPVAAGKGPWLQGLDPFGMRRAERDA